MIGRDDQTIHNTRQCEPIVGSWRHDMDAGVHQYKSMSGRTGRCHNAGAGTLRKSSVQKGSVDEVFYRLHKRGGATRHVHSRSLGASTFRIPGARIEQKWDAAFLQLLA